MHNVPGVFGVMTVASLWEETILDNILGVLGVAVSSYLLGSLCFAIIITKLFSGEDIRQLGSGNAGTANVLRSVGFLPGALTCLFDFLKGVLAVYIGYRLFAAVGFNSYSGGCFASFFVLVGHLYPLFFKYRGGKGVVTIGGILAVLNLKLFLILSAFYLAVLAVSRITSVAALSTFALLPFVNAVYCLLSEKPWLNSSLFFLCVSLLIFYSHRDNIKRLRAGEERKLVIKKSDS